MLCCSFGCGTVFCYVIIEGMSWHPVAAMICRWYVMHILLGVILSPPTNELQLLMSFPGRSLLRKRCARLMFALFQQTSDLTFGDCRCQEKFPCCKTSSSLLKLNYMFHLYWMLSPFVVYYIIYYDFRFKLQLKDWCGLLFLKCSKIQNWTLHKGCLIWLKINKHLQLKGKNGLVMQCIESWTFISRDKSL
jgi:hypothetical protein